MKGLLVVMSDVLNLVDIVHITHQVIKLLVILVSIERYDGHTILNLEGKGVDRVVDQDQIFQ